MGDEMTDDLIYDLRCTARAAGLSMTSLKLIEAAADALTAKNAEIARLTTERDHARRMAMQRKTSAEMNADRSRARAEKAKAEIATLKEAISEVAGSSGCCDACPCHMRATRKARAALTGENTND